MRHASGADGVIQTFLLSVFLRMLRVVGVLFLVCCGGFCIR